jgi:hypothetical protein
MNKTQEEANIYATKIASQANGKIFFIHNH